MFAITIGATPPDWQPGQTLKFRKKRGNTYGYCTMPRLYWRVTYELPSGERVTQTLSSVNTAPDLTKEWTAGDLWRERRARVIEHEPLGFDLDYYGPQEAGTCWCDAAGNRCR